MSRTNVRNEYEECLSFLRQIEQGRIPDVLPDLDGKQLVWLNAVNTHAHRQHEFIGWRNWWRYDCFRWKQPDRYRYSDIPF